VPAGYTGTDTYADGAADPFGAATEIDTDLSIFATYFTPALPPPSALLPGKRVPSEIAQLPFDESQEAFGTAGAERGTRVFAVLGWHGTAFDDDYGAIALVPENGKLAGLVGKRLLIAGIESVAARSIRVLVLDTSRDMPEDEDITVPRRLFLALSPLWEDALDVKVEVLV
jgi:hypothetical protein